MSTININKLNDLIGREEEVLNGLPEHTLDWYTYKNRLSLLDEVKALVKPDKKAPKEEAVKAPKKVAPSKEVRGDESDV